MDGKQLTFPFLEEIERKSKITQAIKQYQTKGKRPPMNYHGKVGVTHSCYHYQDID